MAERAACPRCDAWLSEIYYEDHHRWCGWNCRIEWKVCAFGPTVQVELSTTKKPTPEQRQAVAALANAEEAAVDVLVDGERPPEGSLSPWLDSNAESPPDLSREGKRLIAREEKRARLMAEAARRIDEGLGSE